MDTHRPWGFAAGFLLSALTLGSFAWSGCSTTSRARPTGTPADSPTITTTGSRTRTFTPTETTSYTQTATRTITPTYTISNTRTETRTFTITLTPSETYTPTDTYTPTNTPIPAAFPFCDSFEAGSFGPEWSGGFRNIFSNCPFSGPFCQDDGGGYRVFDTTTAQTGTYSLRLGDNAGAGGGLDWAAFTIALPGSGTPTLSFAYRHQASDYPPYDWFECKVLDSACSSVLASLVCDLPPSSNPCNTLWDGGWTTVSYPLTAYIGQTVTIWFGSFEDGGCAPSFVNLDDVCVQ